MPQDLDDLELAKAPSLSLGLRALAGVGALAFALIAVNLAVVIVRLLQEPEPDPRLPSRPLAAPSAAKTLPALALFLVLPVQPALAADWRAYGPLSIDWSSWQLMDGSLVTRSRNAKNQMLYLSVHCKAGQINVTGAEMAWKGWEKPQAAFETKLLKEACQGGAGGANPQPAPINSKAP
ncbi:hypothetical protein KQ304_13510 [Synechococcus sp. CS-1329]|uniref:hypothetical protein n=1 Tax=Synechococcus sp. CS-1329 TaxID=2847975 RepID=UPI00223ABC09|nr:hypothetical protein [Synechococcus sp. CS-1329]MCT0219994.1 hypothetical protein [Synechococcus sp. CS-1329]